MQTQLIQNSSELLKQYKNNISVCFCDALSFLASQKNDENKRIALFCGEQDYFLIGKPIKDALVNAGNKVIFFSVDYEALYFSVDKLLSGEDFAFIVGIGSAKTLNCIQRYLGVDEHLFFVPTDCSAFSLSVKGVETCRTTIVYDSNIVPKSLSKSRRMGGYMSVLSKQLFLVENHVNRLIGGLFDCSDCIMLLNGGIEKALEFAKSGRYELLAEAIIAASVAITIMPFGDYCAGAAEILAMDDNQSNSGERQFYIYKRLLGVYKLFLNNDTSHLIKLPDCVFGMEKAYKLVGLYEDAMHENLPDYLYNNEKVEQIKAAVCNSESANNRLIDGLIDKISAQEQLCAAIYKGRKYTVELFSVKDIKKALCLAAFITEGDCLAKLVWADGLFEYI